MEAKKDEPTDKADTSGTETDKVDEKSTPSTPLLDVATSLAERIEKANVKTEQLLKEQVDLEASKRLGGELGGNVLPNLVSEEDKKIDDAAEFFKGTSLEKAIKPDGKK